MDKQTKHNIVHNFSKLLENLEGRVSCSVQVEAKSQSVSESHSNGVECRDFSVALVDMKIK